MRHPPRRFVWPGVLTLLLATAPAAHAQEPRTLTLPSPDTHLQRELEGVLAKSPYRRLVRQGRLSVSLVDLSDAGELRYAGVDDTRERYAASLPKIGILLGLFDQIEQGRLPYTPDLREKMEGMIRRSDNALSSELIQRIGFPAIAAALRAPRHALYDEARGGGIWVGRGYGGHVGLWRRDPVGNQSHGANTRQVARFLVMMDRGELVSPWASAQMKEIMGEPAIHHKFVRGLDARPNSVIYRKSGTWKQWHADAALVERDGKKYVAVALLDSPTTAGSALLANLIVELDDLVHGAPAVLPEAIAR